MQLNGAMTFVTSNLKDLQGILPQARPAVDSRSVRQRGATAGKESRGGP